MSKSYGVKLRVKLSEVNSYSKMEWFWFILQVLSVTVYWLFPAFAGQYVPAWILITLVLIAVWYGVRRAIRVMILEMLLDLNKE